MPTILIDSHTAMDEATLEFMLTQAKKVQIQKWDGMKMVGKGWTNEVMGIWSGPNMDMLGSTGRPFRTTTTSTDSSRIVRSGICTPHSMGPNRIPLR